MSYRHLGRAKLYTILGSLTMLLAVLTPGLAGASGRHHRYVRHHYARVTSVRQSNVILQSNSNTVNIAAVGGNATASCTNTGNPTATGTTLAVAANVNLCPGNTATGGTAVAANTGNITQTGTNTATATNTSTISR